MLATYSKSPLILNESKYSRKTDLKEFWSDRLIEILIPNAAELHFGQELLIVAFKDWTMILVTGIA
jgi:hypothetical protein